MSFSEWVLWGSFGYLQNVITPSTLHWVERSVMVIATTVLARPLININLATEEAVQIISQQGPEHSFSGSQPSFSQMASGHASGLAQARSCFPNIWKGPPCHGAKREQPHAHEHCCAGWLEFQGCYLNWFTGADRVTWHEDVLLDGGTAADVREGTKTRNFAGVCCCNSLCQCYWFGLCPCL